MSSTERRASRRRFLKQLGVAAVAVHPLGGRLAHGEARPVPGPGGAVRNRAPLAAGAFNLLPLGAVMPKGWLRDQLGIQARGLGGHLDETWADVGSESGWLGGKGESWERGPYFVDGLLPLAYLLGDDALKAKAIRFVVWTLGSQQPNGMFGPATNNDWWPRMVMCKVLTQFYEATGDARVLPFLSRYFAYQLANLPARPLRDWGKFRWQDNALVVLWLYNRTGEAKLLELAELLHTQGFDWQRQYADFRYTQRVTREAIKLDEGQGLGDAALSTHGVNNGQALKAAPVRYLMTGKDADRRGLRQMLDALETYHGLPNGMFSCDEHLAGRNPSQGSELCTVVETMYSLEQSLAILGDAELGDRLEQIAYNALPGTFTDDMWAHQYNQEPNQVEVSLHTKPWTTDGPESNLYGLEPNFGCCTANFHQGWPKFAASLWMRSEEGGLVAAVYAPSEVRTVVHGVDVHVVEETEYPFKGAIRLTVNPVAPARFPLHLRIPAWAAGAAIRVNGKAEAVPVPGTFTRLERVWKAGDVVELTLPMKPRVVTGYKQSVSVARGPLVFALPIGEDWVKLRDRGMTADWQVYPQTPWNYALVAPAAEGAFKSDEGTVGAVPFARAGSAVTLEVRAKRVLGWRAIDGVADEPPTSPVASDQPVETIRLIPYAAAKLRVTSFPHCT